MTIDEEILKLKKKCEILEPNNKEEIEDNIFIYVDGKYYGLNY